MKKISLLLFFVILSLNIFAKNIVLTSIQATYSIASYLTKGTDIEVKSLFGSDVSMDTQASAFVDVVNHKISNEAQAVIDVSRVWLGDKLYGSIRNHNIRIIPIDASTSYDGTGSLYVAFDKDGKENPYVWTSSKNLIKMADIVAKDLVRIYPKNKNIIEKNLAKFTSDVVLIEADAQNQLIDISKDSIISLSDNIDYFINDLNIFNNKYDYTKVNADNVEKIMQEFNSKIFVSDKWLKKNVIKKIKELGGQFVVVDLLDIPMDDNGQMDKEAVLKAYKSNLEKIIEVLK